MLEYRFIDTAQDHERDRGEQTAHLLAHVGGPQIRYWFGDHFAVGARLMGSIGGVMTSEITGPTYKGYEALSGSAVGIDFALDVTFSF